MGPHPPQNAQLRPAACKSCTLVQVLSRALKTDRQGQGGKEVSGAWCSACAILISNRASPGWAFKAITVMLEKIRCFWQNPMLPGNKTDNFYNVSSATPCLAQRQSCGWTPPCPSNKYYMLCKVVCRTRFENHHIPNRPAEAQSHEQIQAVVPARELQKSGSYVLTSMAPCSIADPSFLMSPKQLWQPAQRRVCR